MENDIDQAFAAAHVLGEKLAYSLRLNPAKIDVVAPFVQEFYQFLISDLPIPYAIKLSTLTGVVDRRVRQASVGHKFLPTEVTQAAGLRLRAVAELYQQTTQFELQGLDAIDAKYPQPVPPSNTHFDPQSSEKSSTARVINNDDLNDLLRQARNVNVKQSHEEISSIDEMAQTMDRMSEEMDRVFSNMDKIFDNDVFNKNFSSGLLKHRLKDTNKKNVQKKFK